MIKTLHYLRLLITILRSLMFYMSMIIALIFGFFILLLSALAPFNWRQAVAHTWERVCMWLLTRVCGVTFNVEGVEHLQATPAVILAKHESAWETFFMPYLVPSLVILYKKELSSIPFFGWAMSLLHYIPIDRSTPKRALRTLITKGGQRLNQGLSVLIFPEGTRAAIGAHPPFFSGGALLAKKSGYPVIPIAYDSGKCWPKGFLIYPGHITVVIGAPILTEGKSTADINALSYDWMKNTMQRLSS